MTPQDYDDYHLRLTLPSASLSSFETNKKKKIAEGELQVFTLPQPIKNQKQAANLNVGGTNVRVGKKNGYIRWAEKERLFYFFQNTDEILYAMTVSKKYEDLKNLQEILLETSTVIQYNDKNSDPLSQQIRTFYFQQKSLIQKLGKGFGLIAGTASKVIAKPANQKVSIITQRMSKSFISQPATNSQNQTENKSKWKMLKQKSNQLNQTITTFVKPAIDKYRLLEEYAAEAILHSHNKVLKTILNSGRSFAQAANEAQKAIVEGTTDENKAVQQESNMELSQK